MIVIQDLVFSYFLVTPHYPVHEPLSSSFELEKGVERVDLADGNVTGTLLTTVLQPELKWKNTQSSKFLSINRSAKPRN